jgi:tetratricopeptide (TPR) repeat protein
VTSRKEFVVSLAVAVAIVAALSSCTSSGGANSAKDTKPPEECRVDAGIDLMKQGKLDDAIKAFSDAIGAKPDYTDAYYYRGNAHLKKDEKTLAFADYSKVIDLDAAYTKAYYNRGITCASLGRIKDAAADFLKVLQIRPNDADAHLALARIYDEYFENQKRLALDHYMKYIENGGDDRNAHRRIMELSGEAPEGATKPAK